MKSFLMFILIFILISAVTDKKKTLIGIKRGIKMFLNSLPNILNFLISLSFILALVPQSTIFSLFKKNSGFLGGLIAACVGAISLMPAYISYPLAGLLLKNGVSYRIVAIFLTNLIMVGVLTLPLEAKYFGLKVAIIRNILSFFGAIIIGILVGVFM